MKKSQSGFTLIEIAIVLVIIGLLLGGVLKGQELINSARARALTNKVDGVTAAWFAFQDRYRALPGDFNDATNSLPAGPVAYVNGDGDGTIENNNTRTQVWVQLAGAGFISGDFDGAGYGNTFNCAVGTCPDNGFGTGMVITFANLGGNTATSNELLSGNGIPSDILAEVDRKIDDGRTNSGTMRLAAGGGGAQNIAACTAAAPNYTPGIDRCAAVFRNF